MNPYLTNNQPIAVACKLDTGMTLGYKELVLEDI